MYAWIDLYAPYMALAASALAVAALVASLVLWQRLRRVQQRYADLTRGASGASLEAVLTSHLDNVRIAAESAGQARAAVQRMERNNRTHIQHVALVRYNPFNHTGGDQSFVLVLADADGNGGIVNSLHAREGTRIYAKPLAGWGSAYALTEEEQGAIAKARGSDAGASGGELYV